MVNSRLSVPVQEVEWNGLAALQMQTDGVSIIIVPELGGRIVSLVDRKLIREWLLQPTQPPHPAYFGAKFTDFDPHGWDEMLPTIDADHMPSGSAYAGRSLPDHGDVWSKAWTRIPQEDGICLEVQGVALPYHCKREIYFTEANHIQFDYELTATNSDTAPFPILWTAHPLFAARSQTQIILPADVIEVMNTSGNESWGEVGKFLPWPSAISTEGWAIDIVGDTSRKACRKVYLKPDQAASYGQLRDGDTGATIQLDWNGKLTPYLGIWVDEGMFTEESSVALEPSNAYFDSVSRAWENHAIPVLSAETPLRWSLGVTLGG